MRIKGLELDGEHVILEHDPVGMGKCVFLEQRLALHVEALDEFDGTLARVGDGQQMRNSTVLLFL